MSPVPWETGENGPEKSREGLLENRLAHPSPAPVSGQQIENYWFSSRPDSGSACLSVLRALELTTALHSPSPNCLPPCNPCIATSEDILECLKPGKCGKGVPACPLPHGPVPWPCEPRLPTGATFALEDTETHPHALDSLGSPLCPMDLGEGEEPSEQAEVLRQVGRAAGEEGYGEATRGNETPLGDWAPLKSPLSFFFRPWSLWMVARLFSGFTKSRVPGPAAAWGAAE